MTLLNQSRKDVQRPTTSLTGPKVITNIGCWNVRTLYTIGKSAQLAKEMEKYDIDVLGVSECRWTGHGKVKLSTGESVIFSGREDNLHQHGVAIMMSKKAEQALIEWKPINDRIIYARFFSKFLKFSILQVYAPTNETNEEDKDNFYEQLQAIVDSIHKHDILIVMGDLNAKVGEDNEGCESIMGKHGLGVRNDNGEKGTK
ncbi:craniofacial development protein 2-like [Amphiura filiformis]|uniref:craniofacial development protein 2-like n=1 Tax=Amphiura filiformis TaxID=82378 RepID=UPI003B225976